MEATGEKLLVVVGPTCTGKSECALRLAKEFNGEIVNADSMQVYRHFDIGSAKPQLPVRSEVPHHLIDIAEPEDDFNAAMFQKAADGAISDMCARKRVPIIVGGTGLYLRILLHGIFTVAHDSSVRERLKERYRNDPAGLYEELRRVDPVYAAKVSPNDRTRVIRALEVYCTSGASMSAWHERHGFREQRYAVFQVGLRRERSELYERISRRVDAMLQAGWVDEVRRLLEAGHSRDLKPFHSIGYRDILLYLEGSLGYAEMVESIKQQTRHYAKRQTTWFKKDTSINWFAYPEEMQKITSEVAQFLRQI